MDDTPRQEQSVQEMPQGPGHRLQEAREAGGLTLEEVAGELHLHAKLVRALEDDDYEHLPPGAFVVGYLRNYARLVGLDEDDLIKRYERSQGAAQTPELRAHRENNQVGSGDLVVRLVTYLLVIGLATLLGFWWFSEGRDRVPAPAVQQEAAEPASADQPAVHAAPVDSASDMHQGSISSAAADTLEGNGSQAEGTQAASVENAVNGMASADGVADDSPATNEPKAAAEQPKTEMRLVLNADSWVEVTDAHGQQLTYGLVNSGRELRLDGRPPYRVFLGYAPGVTIYYMGEKFDHAAFRRRNETARFRVGRAEDNAPRSEGR